MESLHQLSGISEEVEIVTWLRRHCALEVGHMGIMGRLTNTSGGFHSHVGTPKTLDSLLKMENLILKWMVTGGTLI